MIAAYYHGAWPILSAGYDGHVAQCFGERMASGLFQIYPMAHEDDPEKGQLRTGLESIAQVAALEFAGTHAASNPRRCRDGTASWSAMRLEIGQRLEERDCRGDTLI